MQIAMPPMTLLLRRKNRDYMIRSERRPGYRTQPPRRPKKPRTSKFYLALTLILLMLAYPIGLIFLWVRKIRWHAFIKLLVSVATGAVFFFLLSVAITIETDNPTVKGIQSGIQKGYEVVGEFASGAADWSVATWNAAVTEAEKNLDFIITNGPAAIDNAAHTIGTTLHTAYNWCADLLGAETIAPVVTPTPTPTQVPTPSPAPTATPALFATASPSATPAANLSGTPGGANASPAVTATPTPTAKPTPTPSPAPTLQPVARVTVYSVENGSYYHMNETCRTVTGLVPGTLEDAVEAGLDPCPRCGVPSSSVLRKEEALMYMDEADMYHTSVNCDAFTGAWTPETLSSIFYRGLQPCTACGAEHYEYEPDEPLSEAMNAARYISVYYHRSGSTYYHAASSCGGMSGAAEHTLAEAILLDGKLRCPSCDPAEVVEEASALEDGAA